MGKVSNNKNSKHVSSVKDKVFFEDLKKLEIAQNFSKKLYLEFEDFVKAIVFFGSSSKASENSVIKNNDNISDKNSDIDVLVIIDDVSVNLNKEAVEIYRLSVDRLILDVDKRLHVTTLKLSTFWDLLKTGDPVVLSILREGVSIIDSGFFDPFKMLLEKGKIRPSPEAISNYALKSYKSLKNSKFFVNRAVIDLYWAVIDASHSFLMFENFVPSNPTEVSEQIILLLSEKEYKNKLKMNVREVYFIKDLFKLYKRVVRDNNFFVSGKTFDEYYSKVEKYCNKIYNYIKKNKKKMFKK